MAPEAGALAPVAVREVAGRGTKALAEGMYRVAPAVGEPLLTHGPDTAPPEQRADVLGDDETGFEVGAAERAPVCASDYYQQVLYAYPAGAPDRSAEVAAQIRGAVARMNAVLDAESRASGGPDADYKMLCDSSGQVRIDPLAVNGTSFSQVVSAARAASLASDRADYLIFVDATAGGSCGIASYTSDERLDVENRSNSGGGYALVYQPCWEGETPMHESAHLMGAVQYSAPNSTGSGGHCNEAQDVMCYSPDGGDRNQGGVVLRCSGAARFDCNFDDYFDSAPEPGEYLETHWNLGSPLNRYINFNGVPPPAEAELEKPARSHLGDRGKKQGSSGERGDWQHFRLHVPPRASSLKVRLFAAPGADVALFLRRGKKPTRNVYACRSPLHNRHATCRIEAPERGPWYAGVMTRGGQIGASYKISVRAKR